MFFAFWVAAAGSAACRKVAVVGTAIAAMIPIAATTIRSSVRLSPDY
jgi:hypothetical protein